MKQFILLDGWNYIYSFHSIALLGLNLHFVGELSCANVLINVH